MSRLVVKKSENEYRLFCNTVDQWVSPICSVEGLKIWMCGLTEFRGNKSLRDELIDNYEDDSSEFYSYKECQKSHKLQDGE